MEEACLLAVTTSSGRIAPRSSASIKISSDMTFVTDAGGVFVFHGNFSPPGFFPFPSPSGSPTARRFGRRRGGQDRKRTDGCGDHTCEYAFYQHKNLQSSKTGAGPRPARGSLICASVQRIEGKKKLYTCKKGG
jgi:hypothetical protein